MVLGSFWQAASGKLVDRWAGLGSAVVFWAALLGVWLWSHGGSDAARQASGWLEGRSDLGLTLLLLAGLLLAAAPSVLVIRATTPVLRLLEGYWAPPARRLFDRRVEAHQNRLTADQARFNELTAAKAKAEASNGPGLPRHEADEYARLDLSLHHRPAAAGRVMPTRVGNVLRAAEDHPREVYGLDSVIVWPRLWLVLPETTRQELAAARAALDAAVTAVVWGVLFTASAPLIVLTGNPTDPLLPTLTAVVVGLGTAGAASAWWIPNRAMLFADLLGSAFDLHRFALYEQLRWPPPADTAGEMTAGEGLTGYLWRGPTLTPTTYTHPNRTGGRQ